MGDGEIAGNVPARGYLTNHYGAHRNASAFPNTDAVRDHRARADPDFVAQDDVSVHDSAVADESSCSDLYIVRNESRCSNSGFPADSSELAENCRGNHGICEHVRSILHQCSARMSHLPKLRTRPRGLEANRSYDRSGANYYPGPDCGPLLNYGIGFY